MKTLIGHVKACILGIAVVLSAHGNEQNGLLFSIAGSFQGFQSNLESRWSVDAARQFSESHQKLHPLMQRPIVFMCSNWEGCLHESKSSEGHLLWEAIVIKKTIRAYAVLYKKGEDIWILEQYDDKELPWYDFRKLHDLIESGGDGRISGTQKENDKTKEPNKALVPTATSVTPAADAPVAPAAAAAHL
jgi:hypothetical protein